MNPLCKILSISIISIICASNTFAQSDSILCALPDTCFYNTIKDTIVLKYSRGIVPFETIAREGTKYYAVTSDGHKEEITSFINGQKRVMVKDGDGHELVIDKDGNVMGVEEYRASGGNERLLKTFNAKKDSLMSTTDNITFEKVETENYGFDKWRGEEYDSDQYPTITDNNDYRPAYIGAEKEKTIRIKVNKTKGITFKSERGVPLIANETTNRNKAIDAAIATEVTNRNAAITNKVNGEVASRISNAISTEVTNRNSAISSAIATEVTNRNEAIDAAIATEVTNRNKAIATETTNRNKAINTAVATEVTNRNSAISSAISTEVTNRNTAITNAVNALDVASVGGSDRVLTTISETNGKIAASQRYARVKSGYIYTDNKQWRYMKIATLTHYEPRRLPILIHGKEGWNGANDGWFGILTISCNYYKTWGATLRILRGTGDTVNVKFYIIYDSGSQGNATLWIDLRGSQYNSYTYSVIAPEDHITRISLYSHNNGNNGATSTSPLTEDKTYFEVPTHEVAYKTDNVASATKLQTARSLWGQTFDGTADIGGDMTFAAGTNGRVMRILKDGSFRLQAPTSGDWVCGFLGRNAANTANLAGFGVYGTKDTVNYYYMGVGHGSPCLKVTPAGDMTINGSMVAKGDVTAYSDARVKSDIEELSPRGELRPVSYIKDGRRGIGFIAQEVREVYPELVREDEDEMLSLNYNGLVAVLYAEVQELRQALREIKG